MSISAEPKLIKSPYSGMYIKPKITTREDPSNIYTEAIYICPNTNQFVQKVILSVESKNK